MYYKWASKQVLLVLAISNTQYTTGPDLKAEEMEKLWLMHQDAAAAKAAEKDQKSQSWSVVHNFK